MARALITGGGGFVAKYLERHLHSLGYEVWRTVQSPDSLAGPRILSMDVRKNEEVMAAFEASRPDEVYHLAGISFAARNEERQYYDVNFTGFLHVLDAAREVGAQVLTVSSAYVYGAHAGPVPETAPLMPINAYGASKAAAEMAACAAAKTSTRIVRVRPFNHTGPGQPTAFFVPTLVRQLAEISKGRAKPTLQLGDLSTIRDMSDVRDVVKAYPSLLHSGVSGEVYNVGTGVGWRMSDIVALAQQIAHTDVEVIQETARKRATDIPELVADIGRLEATIDWAPQYDFDRTLRDMFRAELDLLDS